MKHIKSFENNTQLQKYAILQIGDIQKSTSIIEIIKIDEPTFVNYKKYTPVEIKYLMDYINDEILKSINNSIYSTTLEYLNKKILKQSDNIEELINILPVIINTQKYNI